MKCRTLTISLSLVLLLFMVANVSASVYIPTTTYFGSPDYGTYINFDENKTFSTIYLTGDTVVIDGYVISSQYSNLTITQFFDEDYLILNISVPVASTSVITVNGASNGYTKTPQASFSRALLFSETFTDSTYTLQITHTTPIVCVLHYRSTQFITAYEGVFENAYVALMVYSIVPIIIASLLILSAVYGDVTREMVLAAIIGLIIYAAFVFITLPMFFALENIV